MEKKHYFFMFIAACHLAGCVTERVIVTTEEVGCESDAECDDRRAETDDWCDVGDGVCNHVEYRDRRCESFAECDDGDPMSVDSCEEGVCHHAHEVYAPFDPSAPERQDAYLICETPHDLRWTEVDGIVAHLILEGCYEPALWSEDGYRMTVVVHGLESDETARIRITPQLRVGDPSDRSHVTLSVYDPTGGSFDESVALAGDFSVAEIEAGFEITISGAAYGPVVGGAHIVMRFQPIGEVHSRTIQWALPEGGVTRVDEGRAITTVPASSSFMRVPRHGFLRVTEGPMGEMRCEGEVRELDIEPGEHFAGYVRTESDPEVFHLTDFRSPRLLQRFQGVRGAIDWPLDWRTVCAGAFVVPDGSLDDPEWERSDVGIRPGRVVTWFDWATRIRRVGYTERNFVVYDAGSFDDRSGSVPGIYCSRYPYWRSRSIDCALDITDLVGVYSILAAPEVFHESRELDLWSIEAYTD